MVISAYDVRMCMVLCTCIMDIVVVLSITTISFTSRAKCCTFMMSLQLHCISVCNKKEFHVLVWAVYVYSLCF